jgi:uncharacterized protein (TIRG00374 family)
MNQPEVAGSSRSWIWQWLIGILLTGGAVFMLSRVIKWEDFKTALTTFRPEQLLLLVGIYLISMFFRAFCWQTLLQRKVSLGRALLGMNEGYFLNTILPLRLGELGRSFLIGRRTGMGTLATLSTVVVERAYDLAIAAGILLATLPFVLKMDWARSLAVVLLLFIIGSLFGLFLAARHRDALDGWLMNRFGHLKLYKRLVQPSLRSLLAGFAVLTRFEFFAISLSALLLSWGLALVRDYLVISTLVPAAPLWWAMLAISVSNLGGALPSMMASLGTFEGAATGAMVLAGARPEVGLVYALVVHIIHLISSSIIGAIGLAQEGQSLTKLVANLRALR